MTTPTTAITTGTESGNRSFLAAVTLSATDGHLPNHQGRRFDRPAKSQIVADGHNACEHLLQRGRDRHLGHREGQFAIPNPNTDRPARVIAGNNIHALSYQLGN